MAISRLSVTDSKVLRYFPAETFLGDFAVKIANSSLAVAGAATLPSTMSAALIFLPWIFSFAPLSANQCRPGKEDTAVCCNLPVLSFAASGITVVSLAAL